VLLEDPEKLGVEPPQPPQTLTKDIARRINKIHNGKLFRVLKNMALPP
jgi:hypothetical protein